MTMSAAMIKGYKISKHEKTAPDFLFIEGQMHLYPSVLISFLCYKFVETLFKMQLNTVTLYKIYIYFNSQLCTQQCIMPL